MAKIRVAVLFGGRSAEHPISLRSATSVVAALSPDRYDIVPIAITPEGRWLSAPTFEDLVQEHQLIAGGRPVARLPDPTAPSLIALDGQDSETWSVDGQIDVVIPVLHGPFGEDGTIQGLLELAGLPYVGCGVLASAAAMDKDVMKRLFAQAGLTVGPYQTILRKRWLKDRDAVLDEAIDALGWPIFTKPANLGSSVGISRATDRAALEAAIDLAAHYDRKLILEAEIPGREVELSVLGNDEPMVSVPGEIRPGEAFYSFEDKYAADSKSELTIPADLPPEVVEDLQSQAVIAFKAIDGSGLARADFFVRSGDNKVIINELNTMPGFTSISMYPKLWEASGLPYEALLERLIELALERFTDRANNAQ